MNSGCLFIVLPTRNQIIMNYSINVSTMADFLKMLSKADLHPWEEVNFHVELMLFLFKYRSTTNSKPF